MSADDITLGGRLRPPGRPMLGDAGGPPRLRSAERPTVPIDCSQHQTSQAGSAPAPRAIDLEEAQQNAAALLSGPQGYMAVGRPGIEEMAWFVARIRAVSIVDVPADPPIKPDDLVTLDVEIDVDDLGGPS